MTETVSHIALRQIAPNYSKPYFSVLDGIKIKTDLDQRLIITMPDQLDIISNDRVELINGTQFKWLGRTDDIANTGGVKVNLLDIENKLKNSIDCPFFIAKLADDKLGETVVIVIAQKDKKSNFDFQSISKFERPRKLLLVKEFIYTATNKLIKNMDAYKDIVSLEKP
jgi:O-succinylbenzoic acid--CoA ligase